MALLSLFFSFYMQEDFLVFFMSDLSTLSMEELKKQCTDISSRTRSMSVTIEKDITKCNTDRYVFQSRVDKLVQLEKKRVQILIELGSRDGKNHYKGSSAAETTIYKLISLYKEQNNKK